MYLFIFTSHLHSWVRREVPVTQWSISSFSLHIYTAGSDVKCQSHSDLSLHFHFTSTQLGQTWSASHTVIYLFLFTSHVQSWVRPEVPVTQWSISSFSLHIYTAGSDVKCQSQWSISSFSLHMYRAGSDLKCQSHSTHQPNKQNSKAWSLIWSGQLR